MFCLTSTIYLGNAICVFIFALVAMIQCNWRSSIKSDHSLQNQVEKVVLHLEREDQLTLFKKKRESQFIGLPSEKLKPTFTFLARDFAK